ncbi:MAG: sugar phosphate nucleotidyltransferase [Bacteroidales bacterium]|nr:sugar phosphate nucleotidyltransferase [Bacteroidales bacterium]
MTENNRYCVIMCGGTGSRLWPKSRTRMPKQFIDFLGTGQSLLQLTVARLKGIIPQENIFMLTQSEYAPLIKEQVPEISDKQILMEPAHRRTAPGNAWAAYHIKALNPDAKIMVAPADNIILRVEEFRQSVVKAFEFIEQHDTLLTFGVKPTRPETRYGYIQQGKEIDGEFAHVKTFTEKPDLELAKVFVDSGEFYWNTGIFFWSADAIIKALSEDAASKVSSRFAEGEGIYGTDKEMDFIKEIYAASQSVSVDYAVLEKADNVSVLRVDGIGWTDLGTWGSLYDVSPKTREGNVTQGAKTMMLNSRNNIVSATRDKLVIASGLNDYIIADSDNALLIVPRSEEQKIRNYVREVKTNHGKEYL